MRPSLPPPGDTVPARGRSVRSFVIRAGRTTDAQRRALTELWPRFGVDFTEEPLDLDALFARRAPREAEIGFGNGEHLLALALRHPDRDFLGIEVHPPGVGRLLLALEAAQLTNVRVICHDAVQVLDAQIPSGSLAEIRILFPDPWPKKRHHKRRLIQPDFAACLADRLMRGGRLRLATDWEPYAQYMLQVLNACTLLENSAAGGSFADESPERTPTRFEQRGRRLGHDVWELAFRRR
ncbi:MAG TPA: tRNA (guanosine(46)-N7)-methyltransferase TrmB [Steroidobacteraceae bacterium]|nr:tRNA (guanosine(46)-N7)-methyltransferase TrmB [Steroidobacteraceae bacterium]